ncbi:IPTL-CTERM sorting domain-containing protein [Hydrogenophaga soli]
MKKPQTTLRPLVKIALPTVAVVVGAGFIGSSNQSRSSAGSSRKAKTEVAAVVTQDKTTTSHDPLFSFSTPPAQTTRQVAQRPVDTAPIGTWNEDQLWQGHRAGRTSGSLLNRLNGGVRLGKPGLAWTCQTFACISGPNSGLGCSTDADCAGTPAPTVTAAKITISGASGAGGVFIIGDTITATWNNTASGDNNTGVTGVTVNFSQFGGGAAVVATNSGGTWTATYTIVAGGNSGSNKNVSVTATNGSATTTTDDANATLDNAVPTLSAVGVSGTTSTDTTLAGTSNETGTGYWIAVANGSTAPTAAQVVAATTYSGVTIVASGNGAMTATVAKNFAVAGLSASTTYTLYLVAKDTAGNSSAVANTNVTTNAPANAAPVASAVTITGTAKVGVQLTGGYTYSDANGDTEGTSTFRWMSDTQSNGATKAAISGATASTYTPVAGDQGKYLFFCVTPVATSGTSPGTEVCSSATAAVAVAEAAPVASAVTITGTAKVGVQLTGGYTYSDVNGDTEGTSTFRWMSDTQSNGATKAAISGATASTYTPVAGDQGKYLFFCVTPVATSGTSPGTEVCSSATATVAVAEAAPVASAVTITGTAKVGVQLTGGYTYSDVNGDTQGTSTFRWMSDTQSNGATKAAISGATASTYTPVAGDQGKYLFFCVTPVATSGTSPGTEVCSSATAAVAVAEAAPVASAVTITGTAKVGVQLTGGYTYSDVNGDTEGTSTFRWMSDTQSNGATKAAISGATANTYTPVAGDQGKYLFFCVTPVATTGTSPGTEVCSSATAAVAPANVTPTFVSAGAGSLTVAQSASATDITGLLHVSDSDSAQTETWTQSVAPSHGTLSFASATASSGSTDITPGGTITYTPTASYVGNDSFTVQVSDGSASATRVINVTVGSARTVTVNALTLNAMVANTPFVSQSFSAAGGYGAYTYSVSAGSLPAGMLLNTSTGALSGTPTTAGAYNFTIQAADSSTGTGPFSGTRNFTGSVVLNGTCGTANGTAIAYQPAAANLCSAGTASAVTVGSPWTWTCAGASGGTTANCSAPNGSTATGSGSGRMEITSSSGGTAWQVQSASFVSTASTGSTPPAGYSFPHGLLDLRLDTGTAGTSATVTITYPSALPANAVYWKYGRTTANTTPHWYQYAGATISGNTVTLTLTDGADGDDDLDATNSLITDPGGPGLPGDPSGVPTLSQWGQLALSGLLAMVGVGAMRRRRTLNK